MTTIIYFAGTITGIALSATLTMAAIGNWPLTALYAVLTAFAGVLAYAARREA